MTAICPHCRNSLDPTSLARGSAPVSPEQAPTLSHAPGRAEEATLAAGALPPMPQAPFGGALGDYELLNELGAGGMGTVYRARQRSADRVVAIKVIRADVLAGLPAASRQEWVQRFQAEARATAKLEHDHIVTVYDVRECAGHHFYSMRYVEGRSLAELVRAGPVPNQRAAAYLEPIARAVHHAHSYGILHRDLKPSNILLDGNDRPFVTDFGLVKLLHAEPGTTAPEGITKTGHVMGTPEYMSPEQASNSTQVTVASDVYSLGATLYDLLTGRPPFRAASALDTLLQVLEQEPVPPRQLNPAIDRDLETIVLKCLQKDPSRRYGSAAELADDLQRYRQGEPITARPVSRVEKLMRWCRRKPLAASLVAALALVLIGATAVSTALALWAWQEKGRADENASREGLARQDAERNEKQATDREAAKEAVLKFVEERIIAAARPAGQEGGLGYDVTVRQAIEAALPLVESSFRDQPLTEARLRMTLGASFLYLGEFKAAADQYLKARSISTQHLGADHADTLQSIVLLATAYGALGQRREAFELFDQTLAVQKRKLGEDHPDTLLTMSQLAGSYLRLGRHEDALKLNRESLTRRTAKLGATHPDTLQSMNNVALNLGVLGRNAEALELSEQTHKLREATRGPDHPETLESMSQVAMCYHALERYKDAIDLYEQTLELKKKKLGPEHPETLHTMHDLALSMQALGKHHDVLKLREHLLPLMKKKLGVDHPRTLGFMHSLADTLITNGRRDEGFKLHQESVDLARTRFAADHADVLWGMHLKASSHAKLLQHAEALKLYEEIAELSQKRLGPNHADTLFAMQNVAINLIALRRNEEAIKLLEVVLARRRTTIGPDHKDSLWTMWAAAECLLKLGRGGEALPLLDECLQRAGGQPTHALMLLNVIVLRFQHFKGAKDVAGCRATAEMWESILAKRLESDPAIAKLQGQSARLWSVSLYNAACMRGVGASHAAGESKTPSAEASRLAKEEADKAMDWLRKAVDAGFKIPNHIASDPDLTALRDREDFKKLLEEVRAGAAKGK